MITGKVTPDLEPVIQLEVFDDGSLLFTLSFVVDTGFSEDLTLSADVIAALGLPSYNTGRVVLADNSVVTVPMYQVNVIWDGQSRLVAVHQMERPLLVGMGLMRGYKLTVEAEDGGAVLIEPNP